MKEAASGYKGGIDYIPPTGVFCCAKSHDDEAWYRAKIVEVIEVPGTGRSLSFVFLLNLFLSDIF